LRGRELSWRKGKTMEDTPKREKGLFPVAVGTSILEKIMVVKTGGRSKTTSRGAGGELPEGVQVSHPPSVNGRQKFACPERGSTGGVVTSTKGQAIERFGKGPWDDSRHTKRGKYSSTLPGNRLQRRSGSASAVGVAKCLREIEI